MIKKNGSHVYLSFNEAHTKQLNVICEAYGYTTTYVLRMFIVTDETIDTMYAKAIELIKSRNKMFENE